MARLKYKLFDDGKVVGIFTAKEIRKRLGCRTDVPKLYADHGMTYKKRFRFEVDLTESKSWADEWDKIRLIILENLH